MNPILDTTHGKVTIGKDCVFGPNVVLVGPLSIANCCRFYPNVCVGYEAEHVTRCTDWNRVITIGEQTILRENVIVQRGIIGECGTCIGSKCYIMHGCHIAHDVVLEDDINMAPHVVLGGHTVVMTGAYFGLSSCTHPFTTIGAYAMVGMGSVVVADVPPGCTVMGSPARVTGANTVGLQRAGLDRDHLPGLMIAWNHRRQGRREAQNGPTR